MGERRGSECEREKARLRGGEEGGEEEEEEEGWSSKPTINWRQDVYGQS